jgi:Uma2 family endonuclease
MVARSHGPISEAEYLAAERAGTTKHEYYRGEVVAMVGASEPHNLITLSTAMALYPHLRGRGCKLYSNDMRVSIPRVGLYTYPDLVIVCGEARFTDDWVDTLINPLVIIEVLSPSTEREDRGRKFWHYRTLPSLQDYVLIAQDAYAIERFSRQADGQWLFSAVKGSAAAMTIPAIDFDLPLARVYEQLDPPPQDDDLVG